MTEDLKNLCRSMITASHYNQLDDRTFDNYIKEICQLFEAYIEEGKKLGRREALSEEYRNGGSNHFIVPWDKLKEWNIYYAH